ncbi:MAG: carbohydrate ABC transporter permease [Aristaeellaceae bacterium]
MIIKRETRGDKIFSVCVYILLALVCLIVIYPLYYMFIVSISNGYAVIRGEVTLLPKGVNFGAYQYMLSDRYVPRSYLNTVIYTVFGTLINVVMTALCAYPLSRKKLYGRGFFTLLIVFTMFFDAGIISNFMVVLSLGIKNTIWAILLPPAINVWYMIIMRTFFQGIPEELHESAYIDGANDLVIFGRIILPLSKAVLATMVVFYAVWHWNSFFPELVYLDDRMLYPMQLILRNMLLESDAGSATVSSDVAVMGRNIKYAAVFITVLPILVVYPFAQKYFVKGVMVGSVKG